MRGVCGVDGLRLRLSCADGAAAQTCPSRPIHIVVSSSPGGVSKWSRLIRDANIKVG
jgi:hypothetical protein